MAPENRKRGRPATGIGTPVLVRLSPELLSALDAFIQGQDRPITRPEAIRVVLADFLAASKVE